MNISEDKIQEYPDDNAIVVTDPRVFRGVLRAAQVWGSNGLSSPNIDADEIEDIMTEFASKVADIRAKYEVTGDTRNADTSLEGEYYDELNALQTEYRTKLFDAMMDYISDDDAIGFMIELLENK